MMRLYVYVSRFVALICIVLWEIAKFGVKWSELKCYYMFNLAVYTCT